MRTLLLWAARNRWLQDHLPRLPFMRRAVRRFLPGETLAPALDAASTLQQQGISSLLTYLGEGLGTREAAATAAAEYHAILRAVRDRGLTAEISVKPTQLGLDLDEDLAFRHLVELATAAAAIGSYVWIDMESSAYTERTLQLYERLRATQPMTGICLQAYLHRTPADIDRLLPLGPAIRLVKGAYDEPASIAVRDKRAVDEQFLSQAMQILEGGRTRSVRLGLGTHDVALIERIVEAARERGIGPASFEVEMLYGIRAGEQVRLTNDGLRVATLISYGEHWYPWYMRRLAERPANITFALRSLLP